MSELALPADTMEHAEHRAWWRQQREWFRTWLHGQPAPQEAPKVEAPATRDLERDDHVTYGKLMLLLTERSLHPWCDRQGVQHAKLTLEERQAQVERWAHAYSERRPDLAQALAATAQQYRQMQERIQAPRPTRTPVDARQRLTRRYEVQHEREREQSQRHGY